MPLPHAPRRFLASVALSLAALSASLLALPTTAAATDSSALIGEALDQPVDLKLNGVLSAAASQIKEKTGVPVRADAAVWELLPWGEQTNLTATIPGRTLRDALGAITRKLGLTYRLDAEEVVLEPLPALRRLGRRSTVQELQALDLLAGKEMATATGAQKVQDVLTAIDVQLDVIKNPSYAVYNRLPPDIRTQQINVPRNATMLQALEAIVTQTRATWYPWGKDVVVVTKETLVRDQLAKTISARYSAAELAQVLEDLRKRAGVDFSIEPGALQKVPIEFRTVKIFWDNVPVAQALESLKASTGLDYQVTDAGVTITNANPAATAAGGGGGDPVVAILPLDGGVQMFIRESQVPADLKPYLRLRLQKELDGLRKAAVQEGFPTTQPATQPGTAPRQK